MLRTVAVALLLLSLSRAASAEPPPLPDTSFGDSLLQQYFAAETDRLSGQCLAEIANLEDWNRHKAEYRRQLFDMLGLDPLPERTPLNAETTGVVDHAEFTVEKLHFQSRPGLYVTGNVYVPKNLTGKAPAILYVCGHGQVKKDGVSYGNKTSYQHHGEWFARHGYVCLTIDTIQLGEIEGLHHGTYREGMWWWHSHGYTPAGVEAWNGIRALDYLQSRPEVDGERIGVTGRSGGGAYSWWIAALDERVKVAVPVAGITSLKNHVVDDCIEGHCDCMFMVNTYGWDFPLLAALVAPRPLLISNTDKDRIFPLDGVYDVYMKTRRIYDLFGATDKLGLQITEGPHKDTQELRVHAFVWFEWFLKGTSSELDTAAPKLFQPEQLKVFSQLPADEQVTNVQDWFIPLPETPVPPQSPSDWTTLKSGWQAALSSHVLDEVPGLPAPCELAAEFLRDGIRFRRYRLFCDGVYPLDLLVSVTENADAKLSGVTLEILDQPGYEQLAAMLSAGVPELIRRRADAVGDDSWSAFCDDLKKSRQLRAWFTPRGIGSTEWTRDSKERTHILRRFMLLGKTADELQTYDALQALRAIRGLPGEEFDLGQLPVTLVGRGAAAGWALYTAILDPDIDTLKLVDLPSSHDVGPIYLNVRRYFDIPEALAWAAEHCQLQLELKPDDVAAAAFVTETAEALGWDADRVEVYTETDGTPQAGK
ncbi:MAG: alpha/beta hydrolase [Planctomycetaceae bacterium]